MMNLLFFSPLYDFKHLKTMAFIFPLLTATLCLIHLSAAEDCRLTASVIDSAADLKTNVEKGGHLWQHIAGVKKRPTGAHKDDTQKGKFMFPSKAAFDEVLENLGKLEGDNFQSCPSNHKKSLGKMKKDVVLAKDLGVKKVVQCTEIDANKVCKDTKSVDMTGKYIEFYYLWKNSKWVLRTAFPRYYGRQNNLIDMLARIAWNKN